MINREKFYNGYRKNFGKLKQSQVDGLNFLLARLEVEENLTTPMIAYILATVMHEAMVKGVATFQPVIEGGSYNYFKYLIGKLGIKNLAEANKFKGRGYVQITGKTNYIHFSNILGIDLIGNPDLALEKETAYKIMILGMTKGLFTGKRLSQYFNNDNEDFYNARRIINGLDRAKLIQDYAIKFLNILQ